MVTVNKNYLKLPGSYLFSNIAKKAKAYKEANADPSHATGYTRYVEPMALAATACGANGLEIEVHDEPSRAWSDGAQALTPDQFDDTMRRIRAIREVVYQETME